MSDEEQSFHNMTLFYADQLKLVLDGVSVEEVFSGADRKKLREIRILNYHNRVWSVSERARSILLEGL
jgi:hypothetical protein